MGTRHLICVYVNGEYKVAQYGQWNGYYSGQGIDVLEFLQDKNGVENLLKNLEHTRFLDADGIDKEFIEEYERNAPEWSNEPDNRTDEQIRWFRTYITRDLGAKILTNIANSIDKEIIIKDEFDFAKDGLFCEYAYVVDFDNNKFEIYKGFNKQPLSIIERFYFNGESYTSSSGTVYYPPKFVYSFDLDSLPTKVEFLQTLEKDE